MKMTWNLSLELNFMLGGCLPSLFEVDIGSVLMNGIDEKCICKNGILRGVQALIFLRMSVLEPL